MNNSAVVRNWQLHCDVCEEICDEGSFPFFRDYSQSTSAEKNLDSAQDRSQSALWSAVKVSDYRRRLGLHRPGKTA